MKRTIYAVAASTLALAGCASTDAPDYVARAPTEPPQASTSSHEALDARIAYHARAYKLQIIGSRRRAAREQVQSVA